MPTMHPLSGEDLLYDYGRAAIHRLCVDPDPLPDGVEEREVTVEHTPVGATTATTHRAVVGWSGHLDRDFCVRASVAKNAIDLTEAAAIVLAALTVSGFECGRVAHVSGIGTGGDYVVEVDWRQEPALLEIRGVLLDDTPSGSVTRAKVQEKKGQVGEGYVSVTAFQHRCSATPHSVLCFAAHPQIAPKPPRKKGRK